MQTTPVEDAMAAYYAARAGEYERIYHRPGRQAELRAIEAWLGEAFDGREVLEVACGTGWWTPHAAARARAWLATDLNPETLALAQAKPMPACVRFELADAYALTSLAPRRFDAAFVGCWWSHVPRARLPGWVAALHDRLVPGARVVVVDNRFVEGESTPIARVDADGNRFQRRVLDDGSVHEVLKNHPSFDEVRAVLGDRARQLRWAEHWRDLARDCSCDRSQDRSHDRSHDPSRDSSRDPSRYWVLDYRLA